MNALADARIPESLARRAELLRRVQEATILDLFDVLPWVKGGADWTAWRAMLAAAFGLGDRMSPKEFEFFRRCTGRQHPPIRPVDELFVAVGRRGRKSAVAAVIATYKGTRDYREHLAPGEIARIPIIGASMDEAGQILAYIGAILESLPLAAAPPTPERVEFITQVEVVNRAPKITAGRSRAVPCAIMDELAFFPSEGSKRPDEEIVRGIQPAMANIPGSLLVGMSSPYAQRGLLFQKHEELWGQERDDALYWKADTLTMHDTPAIRVWVGKEWQKDPVSAAAEVGSPDAGIVFRADVASLLSRETIKALVVKGRIQLPPCSWLPPEGEAAPPERFNYFAFVDPSGGSSDSFGLSIAHFEPKTRKAVVDVAREWKAPFKPSEVVNEIVGVLKAYRITWVEGDAYGGQWPRERFEEHGVNYRVSERTKHEIYRDVLPVWNGLACELPDDPVLIGQLQDLERRTTANGREIIDHPPKGRDDLANAVAGAALKAWSVGQHLAPPPEDVLPLSTTAQLLERWINEGQFGMKDHVPPPFPMGADL